ncbi:pyridoxal phosphate-dependent aminotransferase [Frankia sp. AiPa1]|uniref:pyridoxal phosphate-dependent aminotransferase n=1 Tax=Frankia sp. AiPa1 TaxID=573492 RepID=UPI00202B80FD|nr:pyridoxal phosphate-dependent aminotransferase [Frankia sp. AiPa1]MCL9758114.1 pyridoxal phosphate-dependent aminotransferase [Frankia sp. AiPa1]
MARPTGIRRVCSQRAEGLPGGTLSNLLRLARDTGAIDLAVGTPGFPATDRHLIDGACVMINTGHNQYGDPVGSLPLRQQIARLLTPSADPVTELTITVGGTEALCVTLLATVDPGDEVVVFEPYYEGFVGAIALAGATPRFVRCTGPRWAFDPGELRAAFGPRTRAILINSPANPTGKVFTAAEWFQISDLCQHWDAVAVSDEVYSAMVFDGPPHISAAAVTGLEDRHVVIGSLSKSHAVSGWRLGFLRADPARTAVLRRVHELTTNGAAVPLQAGAAEAGLEQPEAGGLSADLRSRCDLLADAVRGIGLEPIPPQGGCYLTARLTGKDRADVDAYVYGLLRERGVLVVPGTAFVRRGEEAAFVRIAFNRSWEVVRSAALALGHSGW